MINIEDIYVATPLHEISSDSINGRNVTLYAVLDFKSGMLKYKVSLLKNYKKKDVLFNKLEDAVKYYNERL